MKLKTDFEPVAFLNEVRRCSADVYFITDMGDRINLKSALFRYVFAAAASDPELMAAGRIEFQNPGDIPILAAYLA